jgi:Tfp pilus assembly protein PilF
LALDKAEELPLSDDGTSSSSSSSLLFPRDVAYSNHAVCFLKLGQHEKAEAYAQAALTLNPNNSKAMF